MFRYTNAPDECPQRPKSPKPQVKDTSIPKPNKGTERPTSGYRRGPRTPGTPQKEKTISEKYTNAAYNRVPSPKGRFQSLATAVMGNRPPVVVGRTPTPSVEERQRQNKPLGRACERVQSPSNRPKPLLRTLPVKQSCSDVINKKRPLDIECRQSNIQPEVDLKARPKTSHCSRTESRLENKVLHTVESVLSRAVMKQGKIDETNIENIIYSMRNSIYLENNLYDEELSDIDIELKPSKTTVNEINLSEENSADKKSKPVAGIVRKDDSTTKPERKPYRRIYDQMESASKHTMNQNVSEGDDETYVCVDLPELVFPNFPSSKRNDGKTKVKQNLETIVSKQNIEIKSSKRDGFLKNFEVGDFQTNENHFWNASDDAKLHVYVESLIKNMKSQIGNETSVIETEGEIDSQGTVCRSFCVCKVCVSKKTQSNSVLKQKPSSVDKPLVVDNDKPKLSEASVRRPLKRGETNPALQRGATNRQRLLKPSSKEVKTDSPCKVIKNTNPNFKPESSALNTSLHMPPDNKGSSYTVVDTGNNPEDGDDMYLQRRIRKAPSRRTSTKIT